MEEIIDFESKSFEPTFLKFAKQYFDFKPSKRQITKEHKLITSFNCFHFWQKISTKNIVSSTIYYDESKLVKAPYLSSFLMNTEKMSIILSLSKSAQTIRISNLQTNEVYFSLTHFFFAYASHINTSLNGLFVCIDYEFGATHIFKIIYSNGIPSSLEPVSLFSFETQPKSVVSGIDCVCASFTNKRICIWNANSGEIIRKIESDKKILHIAFDEAVSCFYIG